MNISVIDFVLLLGLEMRVRLYSNEHHRPITNVITVLELLEKDYYGYGANNILNIVIGTYGLLNKIVFIDIWI